MSARNYRKGKSSAKSRGTKVGCENGRGIRKTQTTKCAKKASYGCLPSTLHTVLSEGKVAKFVENSNKIWFVHRSQRQVSISSPKSQYLP